MRLSRLAPALAAGALIVATTTPAIAQGADPVEGVGTTTGDLTVLRLDAGQVLALGLLSDAGVANIDEAAGARSAAAQIAAFSLTSELLDIAQSVPLLAVESTGDEQTAGQEVAIPANPVLSGSALPLSLSALVDETGARATLGAALADLDVLGGTASVTGIDLDLGSSALTSDAAASRGVAVQDLSLLDLEALLEGLGISLTDLPLDTLLGLLEGLGLLEQLPLDALGIELTELSADALLAAVDGLLGQVDELEDGLVVLEELESSLSSTTEPVCDLTQPGDELLGGLLGDGSTVICDTTATTAEQLATVQASIDELTDELAALLDQLEALVGGVLDLLGGTALLNVDGLDLQVVTKATDDVATSVAEVTASLGAVTVGELPVLGSVDLAAPTGEVDALLGQVEGAVGDVLGEIAPSLADLVSVSALHQETSVVEEAGKVVATADFTGLVVEVQPILGELQALLDGLAGVESLADTLEGLGLPVPTTGSAEVAALNELLAPVTDGLPLLAALDSPLAVRVASLGQQSVFTAAAAAPAAPAPAAPAPTLPLTGSSDTLVLGLAMAAAAAALAGRQLLRRNAG